MIPVPRLVAWEVTRRCNLKCRHCRASATCAPYANELTVDEAKAVVADIAMFAHPILILTGGEPLLCPWLWEIIPFARAKGMTPVIGTNATLLDDEIAHRMAACGVPRISVSLDFPDAAAHDDFRGEQGAFAAALRGIAAARKAGVEVQINTTVTRLNRHLLPAIHDLARKLDVQAFHPFLLVPTGRGADLGDVALSAAEYEETLTQIYEMQKTSPLQFKPTDAPQYQRIVREQGGGECSLRGKGCLAGTGFVFVSHEGDVQPCGYFDLKLGNVREQPLSRTWKESPVFDDLRHPERLKGKCGICEFKSVCGGCRARALATSGDYLAPEPACVHVPDAALLNRVQADFPLDERPFARLGAEIGLGEEEVRKRLLSLRDRGQIRRIGAFFDAAHLGYVSTLVAFAVPEERLDAVAARVSAEPGVTHNYSRTGPYNLWFTVVAPSERAVAETLATLQAETGVSKALNLPSTATYKLRVDFSPSNQPKPKVGEMPPPAQAKPFDPTAASDREIVNRLQEDLLDQGLSPYKGVNLARVRELVANGTIRRMGAVVNPRQIGFAANGLLALEVPEGERDAVGRRLAQSSSVSHCYARVKPPEWPYSVYAMVHAKTADELRTICNQLAENRPFALFETRGEYKKSSMHYF